MVVVRLAVRRIDRERALERFGRRPRVATRRFGVSQLAPQCGRAGRSVEALPGDRRSFVSPARIDFEPDERRAGVDELRPRADGRVKALARRLDVAFRA